MASESESEFLEEQHIEDFIPVSEHEDRDELTRTPTPGIGIARNLIIFISTGFSIFMAN